MTRMYTSLAELLIYAPSYSVKSVHYCVVTIGGREGDRSGRCSKPYLLGPAQNSTDEVENYLVNKLNMLGTGYTADGPFLVYHKLLKRVVQVVTCPFLSCVIDPIKLIVQVL